MKFSRFFYFSICIIASVTLKSCKEKESSKTVNAVNDLPTMQITMLDDSQVSIHTLTGKIILILFQSDCDHCQREAREIRENLDAFNGYSIYFLSADEASAVHKFANDYNLLGQKNIYFARTTVDDVIKNFGSIPAPSVYVYANQRLVQKFNGEVAIEKILNVI